MTLAHRSHRLPYRLSKRDSRIRRCYGGYQLIWKALVNNNSLVFFHLLERRSNSSLAVRGRSLSIGLEDGSSGSVVLLGFLGGLSSSLVWVVWESWSIEPDSGWSLSPWSFFELDSLNGGDESDSEGEFHFNYFIVIINLQNR